MTARSVFIAADGRIRAGWRILLFFILVLIVGRIIGTVIPKSAWRAIDSVLGRDAGASSTLILTLALLAAHAIMLRWVDRVPWSYVWLNKEAARPRILALGWLLGALPILVPSLLLFGVGWLATIPSAHGSWWFAAAEVTLFLMLAAMPEELLSRGYMFAAMRDGMGATAALLITSIGFGLLHLFNPGADARSVTVVALSGLFLGAIVLVTRSLYAAWMSHWAWNWVMGVPLHTFISGRTLPHPDYQIVDAGPDWITGGVWGPEGGIGAALGILTGMGYLYWRSGPTMFGLRRPTSSAESTVRSGPTTTGPT